MCFRFCCKVGKTAIETCNMLKLTSGEETISRTQKTLKWFSKFRSGMTSVDDTEHVGHCFLLMEVWIRTLYHRYELWIKISIQTCPVKWRTGDWFLHHDNAPAHAEFLARSCMTAVPHLSYLPGVATCDISCAQNSRGRDKMTSLW